MRTKDVIARVGNTIHRTVFNGTNGRVMGKMIGMPALMLTTTGRKSGKKRQTMLTSPIHDDDRNPIWFLNLKQDPDVEVTMGGKRRPMRARIAKDEEREELWKQITSTFKNYGGYQTKTDRVIPLVVLEPR
jgi:deazaflavin-dependent oxidoreductase (nitroreductase family)